MRRYLYPFLFFSIFSFLLSGCVYVISKGVRKEITPGLSLKEVIKDPEAYRGKVVLWGGLIIDSKNLKEGTRIIILQKDLDIWGRPKESDKSQGRFIVSYPGYLDTAIYRRDREITVAGEIAGRKVLPIGEIEYTYPELSPKEIHLWAEEKKAEYPYPYWPHPWWWDYPYWPYRRWYPYRPWYPHRP